LKFNDTKVKMNENVNAELFTLVITKSLSFFQHNKEVSIMLILSSI